MNNYNFQTDWKLFIELKGKDNKKEDNNNDSSRI